MQATQAMQTEDDPDIVVAAIREVLDMNIGLTKEQAAVIERRLKERYGDRRVRVKKKLQFSSDDLRSQVFQDGMTAMTTPEIARKNGISTRTVYYWMKKGNPNAR